MEKMGLNASWLHIFKGKRVFVTGHSGFKGTWLTAFLHLLGAEIKGYSLLPEDSAPFFNLFHYSSGVTHVFDDIRNASRLQEEVEQFAPDFIFHLAAQPLVLRSYQQPAYTFDVNVVGTANLLNCLRTLKYACTTVISTTDKVYFNQERNILYKEEDRLGGYDPYSASKACTELTIESMRNSFFPVNSYNSHRQCICVGRAGNVIGGGDWSENRIVPDIARALLKEEPIFLRNPDAVRPWQHVLEPLMGYLKLAASASLEPQMFSTAFNFGPLPADHLSVKELAETAVQKWGRGEIKIEENLHKPHEATLLRLDISKAKRSLGWEPKLSADKAIDWTMKWYKCADAEKREFTIRQIESYLSLCE